MTLTEGNSSTHRKICPGATLSTINPTWTQIIAGKPQGKKPIGRSGFICIILKYIIRVTGCKNINCWIKIRPNVSSTQTVINLQGVS